ETNTPGHNDVNDLIKTGITFLEKLGTSLSDGKSLQPLISTFVEKDKDTGKTFLKIPVPDEDIINKAVSIFSGLLQGLKK
ncbi:MAG: hypothetical protein HZA77_12700, partial [Candidatus Schekmanbacteria bacterium]|nr:hypothetical protein [Candidatus Schekmanbacteria bacterium]